MRDSQSEFSDNEVETKVIINLVGKFPVLRHGFS
jgi:hypothetical protein